jgi:beta-lactamase superfamily II metal-dependent hydrolase
MPYINCIKILATMLLMTWVTCTFGQAKPNKPLLWTMINVNYSAMQGDSHLIQTDTGKNILIDTGYFKQAEDMLIPFLISKKVKKLDKVYISHPHQDHYAGLLMLLKKGIRIKEVYFNLPDKEICDAEIPWGCNYKELLEYHDSLTKSGVVVLTAKAGDKFEIGTAASLEILYAYDGVNTPVGRTDINDMSLIMKLTNGTQTALFTGDLNAKIGAYLAKDGNNIKADILKLPHHGTEGAAPDAFFEAVSPTVVMVPSPALLWCSARSSRMKKWVESKKIPTYVNGFVGHVVVKMQKDSFQVITQRSKSLPSMVTLDKCP